MTPKRNQRILIVEDDKDISELIQFNLAKEGFEVTAVYDGLKVLDAATEKQPDLILLDIMLPGQDGLEVCRQLKADDQLRSIPIIMLTAKSEESDIVVGLQLGADDYVPKPFSPKVLIARIRSVLRRSDAQSVLASNSEERQFGLLTIDLLKHKIVYKGQLITLTAIEFNIFEFLSRCPGRVFTREQILNGVWKEGRFIIDRAVDVHIRGLRKKLDAAQDFIETVRGVGYRFKDIE